MTGVIRNSDLSPIATKYIASTKKNPACKISVRLATGKAISAWGQKTLTYLFEKKGIVIGVKKVLARYIKADESYSLGSLEESEHAFAKKQSLSPHYYIRHIVVDEVNREVFLLGDTLTCVFAEHGEAIHYSKGCWKVGEFDEFSTIKEEPREAAIKRLKEKWKTLFPAAGKNSPLKRDISILYGVWRLNPAETMAAREQCGMTEKEFKSAQCGWSMPVLDKVVYQKNGCEIPAHVSLIKLDVAYCKRRSNTFEVITKCGQWNHFVWCDGTRMSPEDGWRFCVYTRVGRTNSNARK